jgi:EmrB/QacA subfamily drug resistance transporter
MEKQLEQIPEAMPSGPQPYPAELQQEKSINETTADHMARPETSTSSISSAKEAETSPDPKPQQPDLFRTQSQASQFSKARTGIIVFSLCMALFLAALDVTIITTALPTIAEHFQSNAAGYTWIGSAYLLACSASAPVWGKISDIFGRKNVILLANIIFMAGSLIAALATSIGMLIAARVVQGIGGGGLVILVYVCVGDLFSMRERPKYYGIMGMVWALASGVGPVVGGVFTEKVSWRWCFYINLPLDGLSLVLLTFFLKLDNPRTPVIEGLKSIDWVGVVTIAGGVVLFLFGMGSGGVTHPWDSAFVLCLIIFGLVTIVLFFINEWKFAKYPVIPLRLFRDSSNLAALGVCFIHGWVFIGASYYLPLYFQVVLLASPILSGVYLFAIVLTLSFMSAAVGIYIKNTGHFREPIWFGMVFMTLGFGLFIDLPAHANWAKIIIYQIIAGIGVGPNFQSPLIALQSRLKGHDIAVGTATFGSVRNLATSLSIVLGGVVFQNELHRRESTLAAALGPQMGRQLAQSSFGTTAAQLRQIPHDQKEVLDQVYTESLSRMWIFYTAFSAFGIIVSLFIKKHELDKKKYEVKTGLAEQERVRLEEKEEQRVRRDARHSRGGSKLIGKDVERASPVDGGAPEIGKA